MSHRVTKSVTFFSFSTQRLIQQEHGLMSVYLGLNICFYALFFDYILGLNICFIPSGNMLSSLLLIPLKHL